MLKRLNEKTSCYSVDKWFRDYEASQYYKRNHCQYPSIDFYKTQRYNSFGNMFQNVSKNSTKKNFFSKTHYSTKTGFYNNKIRKKKFEDFNYRDLQMGRSKSDLGQKEESKFKKIDEVGDGPKQEEQQKEEEEKKDNEDQKKVEENN